jgi:hypothetical protein
LSACRVHREAGFTHGEKMGNAAARRGRGLATVIATQMMAA